MVRYKLASQQKRQQMLYELRQQPDYNEYVDFAIKQPLPGYKRFPGIVPMWDNTARRKTNPFLFRNATPQKYRQWLQHELKHFTPYSAEENFIFINAWNEWAEGNHLEPCAKFGSSYLAATKAAFAAYAFQP